DTFNINSTFAGATSLDTLGGGDTINVRAISGPVTMNTGTGDDTVNVGSAAPDNTGNVDGIDALLTLDAGAQSAPDTLNILDGGDSTNNTGQLTSNLISGLGLSTSGVSYAGFEILNLRLGG